VLRVEIRRQLIAQRGAVRRHPVIGKSQRGGKVGGPYTRDAIDAGLKGVATAGAAAVGKTPPSCYAPLDQASRGG
jgi:hypothetical protein